MWEMIETIIGLFVVVVILGGLLCLNGFLGCWDKVDKEERRKHHGSWYIYQERNNRGKPEPPWNKYLPWWLKF